MCSRGPYCGVPAGGAGVRAAAADEGLLGAAPREAWVGGTGADATTTVRIGSLTGWIPVTPQGAGGGGGGV